MPPRRPVKPEFPTYIPPFSPHVLDATHSSRIRERLCRIRSPSSVSEEDLVAFNIDLAHDVDPSDMLPKYTFVTRPLPFDEDLEEMLNELSVDNHDAYREVLRMEPLPGRRKPRLAYARNFFGSLEDIARYWDTSLDEYYERSIAEAETAGHLHGRQLRPSQQTQSSASPSTMDEVGHIDSGTNQRSKPVGNEARNAEQNTTEFYKGYRFGNGEQMNSGTRVAMVKNFLKMVTHKFMCRDYEPMPNPRERLCIRGVKIQAIQYQFCIAALPSDTKLARARVVEGPILAVHCRDELRYENSRPRASAEMEVAESLTADIERLATKQPANNINNLRVASVGEAFDVFRGKSHQTRVRIHLRPLKSMKCNKPLWNLQLMSIFQHKQKSDACSYWHSGEVEKASRRKRFPVLTNGGFRRSALGEAQCHGASSQVRYSRTMIQAGVHQRGFYRKKSESRPSSSMEG